MAITQAMCSSFKTALLNGEMDFSSDTSQTFKIALYTSSATLSAATTAYSTTNEVSGTGYTAGGNTLTIAANPALSGTTAFLDFSDTTWSSSSISARGALIYKSATGNPAIAVIDFGENKQSSSANFVISFPTADANNAIIRIL
tara:strand:- start:967 stop:1398 length:432 start_codon:yes stop_codon:yes gene_type:complete